MNDPVFSNNTCHKTIGSYIKSRISGFCPWRDNCTVALSKVKHFIWVTLFYRYLSTVFQR